MLEQEGRGRGSLTAFTLWMLNQNLKLQPEDPWILGILVTALQREVEVPGHVPRLLVCQLEHLGVGGGARDVVLHPLLLPLAVGDVEVEEGDARPQGCGNDKLPRHELILRKAVGVVGRHQSCGALALKHRFDDAQACWEGNPSQVIRPCPGCPWPRGSGLGTGEGGSQVQSCPSG